MLFYLVKYSSQRKKFNTVKGQLVHPKPDYLNEFLQFVVKNMDEYAAQLANKQAD